MDSTGPMERGHLKNSVSGVMSLEKIPVNVMRFILTSIPTVPHLEAILLLRGAEDVQWTTEAVTKRLYIGERVAEAILQDLCGAGIFSRGVEGRYQFNPSSIELRSLLDALAHCYASQLVEVTNLIHSPMERKAQQFANAFRWRSDD